MQEWDHSRSRFRAAFGSQFAGYFKAGVGDYGGRLSPALTVTKTGQPMSDN